MISFLYLQILMDTEIYSGQAKPSNLIDIEFYKVNDFQEELDCVGDCGACVEGASGLARITGKAASSTA